MNLSGLHLLLTYQCNYECDHCFVWGSPSQRGTLTLEQVRSIYRQVRQVGTVEWVYLEGGEPFLYYPIMLRAAQEAASAGFLVGLLSNVYWATTVEDAVEWLRPLVGSVQDLTVSTDLFHYDEMVSQQARNALAAAEHLGVAADTIICQVPEGAPGYPSQRPGQPVESGPIMFRGRAAVKLVEGASRRAWSTFTECPHERLDSPGRVHVDCYGNLHLCQGLTLGSLFQRSLVEIVESYDPRSHPVVGPLLSGGPAGLAQQYGLPHQEAYVDACHLCYELRAALRERFPGILGPGQMYGEGLN